jgi:hypothetical protein
MWRFDRPDDPVPTDNFWGRTELESFDSMRTANHPTGTPVGLPDVELTVDVYFPATVPGMPQPIAGRSSHSGGRNRLMLDLHAKWFKDARTPL